VAATAVSVRPASVAGEERRGMGASVRKASREWGAS
jgi:hypothetical protein